MCVAFNFVNLFIAYTMFTPKCWDRQAWANSVDLNQMPQNAASDQGLQCLPLTQQFIKKSTGSEMDFFKS